MSPVLVSSIFAAVITVSAATGYTSGKYSDCITTSYHNNYRNKHEGTSALSGSVGLAVQAETCAIYLATNNVDESKHPCTRGYDQGENLYISNHQAYQTDYEASFAKATSEWYAEIAKHAIIANYRETGHFWQMVWKGTSSVGCAYAQSGQKLVIVCRYYRAANLESGLEVSQNVGTPKPQGQDPASCARLSCTLPIAQRLCKEKCSSPPSCA